MKYKCLILDHDDTVVMSTPSIHYPSFIEAIKVLRPNLSSLTLDDLKPGLHMAKSCNVDFASAGWSHVIPEVIEFMKSNSTYYFKEIKDLRNLILENIN